MASEGGQSPTRRGKRGNCGTYNNNSMLVEDDEIHASSDGEGGETVLWERFERVASAVTKLYRSPSWQIFQQAAASTTEFYKDSVEAERRGFDNGIVLGRQLLCKEVLAWLQSSTHPYVRRDECVNVLLGRTQNSNAPVTPVNNRSSSAAVVADPQQRLNNNNNNNSSSPSIIADELELFQGALNSPPDLTAFFLEECRRHAKRRFNDDDNSNGSGGGVGDGCNKKRFRRI